MTKLFALPFAFKLWHKHVNKSARLCIPKLPLNKAKLRGKEDDEPLRFNLNLA
ncbi:hypothetical protein G9A89_007022 [Geosiphon pyriformis]|nr:hypothetical protein G9A89_007022 [Geosiphon pyriformis]